MADQACKDRMIRSIKQAEYRRRARALNVQMMRARLDGDMPRYLDLQQQLGCLLQQQAFDSGMGACLS